VADRPIIVDEQVPAEGPGRRSRRKLFVAALAPLVVIASLIAGIRDDSEPAVQVSADQPVAPSPGDLNGTVPTDGGTAVVPMPPLETTPTTAPPIAPAPTTTTQPADPTTTTTLKGTRTPVMTATDGRWKLTRVDTGTSRCLELTVGASTSSRLLCDAPAPAGLWGHYATVSTPIGTVLVAMVDRQLTSMSTLFYEGVIAQLGSDPTNQELYYAVGVVHNLGGSDSSKGLDLFLMEGENTLGRANVSLTAGPHPAPTVVTTAPYGIWPGYRKAGYTGLFYGGNEDVGFYDNPSGDGIRCVLWRRFGGPQEGVILDVCPPPADAVFPFAEVRAEGPIPTAVRAAIVVDAPRVTRWTCTWDTGGACFFYGTDAQVIHDPAGSSRSFLAYFPGAFPRNGDRMTVTAYDGETTLGQITLDVQPA
jgi:hypothetical protein